VADSPHESEVTAPGLARNASLLSLGNVASRALGLLREMVIATFFGTIGEVGAFRIAAQVPMLVYDFLVGGMLSAALVPTLSEYAHPARRSEFLRLAGILISVFAGILALLVIGLEVAAPGVAWLLAAGYQENHPELLALTTYFIRLLAPTVWLFSMAGVLTAVLYALQRFTFPAIATAIYNLGVVLAVPLLVGRVGVVSLALGVLLGSAAQFLLMSWDFWQWGRRSGVTLHFSLNWRHPALRKIVLLYLPIAAGLLVSSFQIGLDRRLATSTGPRSINWMQNATTLQQLPLGLISVAIALAALPRLSQQFAVRDEVAYRRTLGRGLRMVLLLITPAAVGLWLLGEPLTRVIFEHGQFTSADTARVVAALNIYVIGMLFAAVDFPLNFAFYARNNTLLPALVGVGSVGVYIVVAFALLAPLGYLGLVWADSAKHASHALIMVGLLVWTIGGWGARLWRDVGKLALAAGAMAITMYGFLWQISAALPESVLGDLLRIGLAGGTGLLVYVGVLHALRLREMREVLVLARTRLR
jgi:putative peptidoglycan lipid II flippase